MIGCEGHEPALMRIFQWALKLLTPHCIVYEASSILLPRAISMPLPQVEKGMRVDAGSLGMAASGSHPTCMA